MQNLDCLSDWYFVIIIVVDIFVDILILVSKNLLFILLDFIDDSTILIANYSSLELNLVF